MEGTNPTTIRVTKGLDIPLYGAPEQKVYLAKTSPQVALIGPDYHGMKPSMHVQVGDRVQKGQVVFSCKKRTGVKYTALGGGVVRAIHRGEKRAFESLVIELDDQEAAVQFRPITDFSSTTPEQVEKTLVDSGIWTSLRTRPYSQCPLPGSRPHSLFVQAMDSHPLAADQEVILRRDLQAFHHGLKGLSLLTQHKVYLCVSEESSLTSPEPKVEVVAFNGPHPAGNPGTHMHLLNPASETKTHWWIDAQDVMAIGQLLLHGELDVTRIIALSGPQVKSPRLLQTRLGADLNHLTCDQLHPGESRVISGSALYGRTCDEHLHYLSRFARQVTVLKEDRKREFLGWHTPGLNRFSVKPIYLSALNRSKRFHLTTSTHGSHRAMVPIGIYEKIMPLDILPVPLLRSLCSRDTESARQLGALELDEEDLALCTFVDPGKVDYGPLLRENLTLIEREG